MKGKKASYGQRKVLSKLGIDTYKWLVQKDCPEFMQLVHKDTGEVKRIDK